MAGLIDVLMLPAVTAGDLEALDQFTAVQQDQLTPICG